VPQAVNLPPGSHQYKFIVDGQWRHDHTAPTVLDNLGNVNNCITVQPPPGGGSAEHRAPAGAGDAARRSGEHAASDGGVAARAGAPAMDRRRHHNSDPYNLGSRAVGGAAVRGSSSYGQIVPARDELVVHHSASLLLPPQLRLLLPYHRGDTCTMPLSVQMQHVFCQSGGEVAVLAMAHRYKDRSITQFLYKPAGPNGRPMPQVLSQRGEGGGSQSGAAAVGAMRLAGRPRDAPPVHSVLQSVRISGAHKLREVSGHEYIAYGIESCLALQGMQTTLRVDRRYKHFHMLDHLLHQQFGPRLVPLALPAKRAFGNLQPVFVEERRLALERYLQLCIGVPQIAASSIFCNFVEADTRAQGDFAHVASATRLLERVSTLQGRLLKYGRRLAAWKKRYFCLCDGALHYYYSVEMSNPFQPLGVIALTEDERPLVTLEPAAECGLDKYYGFTLHTKERTWRLAAPSAAERAEWVRALCRAGVQLSSTGAERPVEVPEPESAAEGAEKEGVLAGSLMKCASKVRPVPLPLHSPIPPPAPNTCPSFLLPIFMPLYDFLGSAKCSRLPFVSHSLVDRFFFNASPPLLIPSSALTPSPSPLDPFLGSPRGGLRSVQPGVGGASLRAITRTGRARLPAGQGRRAFRGVRLPAVELLRGRGGRAQPRDGSARIPADAYVG
jgi:hypothetical protein